jgi:hypothetical protein
MQVECCCICSGTYSLIGRLCLLLRKSDQRLDAAFFKRGFELQRLRFVSGDRLQEFDVHHAHSRKSEACAGNRYFRS